LHRKLYGWVAQVLFAEMPIYIRYLFQRYASSGGLMRQTVSGLTVQGQDLVVNCTGLQRRELARDNSMYPIRGHLIFIEGTPFPPGRQELFSYNYFPLPEEYPYDVYFFPRSGKNGKGRGWLLGGSRETGAINADGQWEFSRTCREPRSATPIRFLQ